MIATDLTARLLAQENINVVRANAKTASFDVVTRVLTIPLWKDMTVEIEDMMQCHEVGHALFTEGAAWMETITSFEKSKQRVVHGYMNVVEDARIEKLMKRRFPGSRKTFYTAYKQLVDRDFFKIKDKDVNTLAFIDRINLYFKCGITLGVKFTDEEKVFVNKVESIETIKEAMALSLEIYEFSKTETKKRHLQIDNDDITFTPEEDNYDVAFEEDDDDSDGEEQFSENPLGDPTDANADESDEVGKGNSDDQDIDDEIESQTDKNLNQSLEELADTTVKYCYYEVDTALCNDPVVNFKTIISETAPVDSAMDSSIKRNFKKEFDNFMQDSERMVNYLVKEFEMRKSAQAYRRQQVSKSGSLNMNKIHQYKLTDDIFKRVTTVPDGKNHGMVFLLDWSGSMHDVIIPTVKQVINLAMFCRRINIPFEVYAFSGEYQRRSFSNQDWDRNCNFINSMSKVADKNTIFSDGRFHLLNLFSSKMSNKEFTTMARRFSNTDVQHETGYSLGDTPLNEALCYMLDFIPDFKRRNNIEKMTLITLTDGQGGSLSYGNQHIRSYDYDCGERLKIKNFIRDTKTQKTYSVQNDAQSQTEALLKMIKDRYDVSSLGFYICENRQRVLSQVFTDNLGEPGKMSEIEEMRKQFKEQGFYSMMGTGRDELFVIPSSSTKIVDEELQVDSDASAAAIARKFGKNLNNKKHSRVLLDRFISYVA